METADAMTDSTFGILIANLVAFLYIIIGYYYDRKNN